MAINFNEPLNAYFLGWMFSDGGIFYSETAYSFAAKLKIHTRDAEVLELFKPITNWTFFVEKESTGIRTYNRDFCKVLLREGLLPDKSGANKNYLLLPNLDDFAMPFFIRGLFDGDGCYSFSNGRLSVSLYMNNKVFLDELSLYLRRFSIFIDVEPHHDMYVMRTRNYLEIEKFKLFVFSSHLEISLKRKLNTIMTTTTPVRTVKSFKDITVITDTGTVLGSWGSLKAIVNESKKEDSVFVPYVRNTRLKELQAAMIRRVFDTGKSYKGLYFESSNAT